MVNSTVFVSYVYKMQFMGVDYHLEWYNDFFISLMIYINTTTIT